MGLDNQEKSQAEQEEEALFNALFPKTHAEIQESLALPVRSSEAAFRGLPFRAKVHFAITFVKNYVHQEYTRFRIRRSLSK